ncbi:MAG: tetratricopeptide repeat protein, partial [Bacteroidia bacterium]
MKNKIRVTILLIAFSVGFSFSQTKKLDSLNTELKTVQREKKIDVLLGLSNEYRTSNEEKALKYALEAKDLAQKAGNKKQVLEGKICEAKVYLKYGQDKKGFELSEEAINEGIALKEYDAVVRMYKSQYYYYRDIRSDMNAAILIIDKVIAFTTQHNLQPLLGDAYNLRGVAYYYLGNLQEAEKCFLSCVAIRKKTGNKMEEAGTIMNIGVLFYNSGEYKKSIEYYTKAYSVFEQLKDTLNIAKSIVNIAMTESDMGKIFEAKAKLIKASELYKAAHNKEELAGCIENISNILSKEGKMDSALIYAFKVLKIREDSKEGKSVGISLSNISSIYHQMKQNDLALEYINKSIAQEEKIGNVLRKASRFNFKGSIYLS